MIRQLIFYSDSVLLLSYQPHSGSSTRRSLVDLGLLSVTFLFLDQDRIQSGTILFTAQSPPPITFPALADANLTFEFGLEKNALQ